MRTLLLFRGAPGCGKSTFIDAHGLRPYTLSADDIRQTLRSPMQTADGSVQICQDNEKEVWELLYRMLETRMQKGEFTVIDATNFALKSSSLNAFILSSRARTLSAIFEYFFNAILSNRPIKIPPNTSLINKELIKRPILNISFVY